MPVHPAWEHGLHTTEPEGLSELWAQVWVGSGQREAGGQRMEQLDWQSESGGRAALPPQSEPVLWCLRDQTRHPLLRLLKRRAGLGQVSAVGVRGQGTLMPLTCIHSVGMDATLPF